MSGIHGFRFAGHLKSPTREQIAQYAARQHLPVSADQVDDYVTGVTAMLRFFDRLDELEEPRVPLRHPYRDPGWVPSQTEDPYNAIIRFCEVKGADEGTLIGKRVGVKDCIAVAGIPMTVGGRRLPVAVPTEDAVVVERLLDAGVTIVAKTNMADMSLGLGELSAYGVTRNPRNPQYTSGGSSSGSAAAVAAGIVDAALGVDEGGSIRIPAAWCGIVGMKATHGLVPSYGLTYMDHTIDNIGPMTASVADNAAMLEAMAGADWRDPQWVRADPVVGDYTGAAELGIEGLRIGVIIDSLERSGCTAGTLEAFERAKNILRRLGAETVPVSLPLWADATTIAGAALVFWLTTMVNPALQAYGHLGRVDVHMLATTAAQYRLSAQDVPPGLAITLLTAEYLHDVYLGVHLARAQNLRLELRRQVDSLFSDVDLLITPTTPFQAIELPEGQLTHAELVRYYEDKGISTDGVLRNTCPFNLTGHPALTLPSGPGDNGLPSGLQIIGPRFDERTVYRAGFAFETEIKSHEDNGIPLSAEVVSQLNPRHM